MEMTAEEICRDYRLSLRKNAQIKILAELNLTTKTEIKRILSKGGIAVKQKDRPKGTRPTVWTPERIRAFNDYYAQGIKAHQMAALLGVARESVRKRILCVEKESAPQLGEQLQGDG